jgi:hypothetical protein
MIFSESVDLSRQKPAVLIPIVVGEDGNLIFNLSQKSFNILNASMSLL